MAFQPTVGPKERGPFARFTPASVQRHFEEFLDRELRANGHDYYFLHGGSTHAHDSDHYHLGPPRAVALLMGQIEAKPPPVALVHEDGRSDVLRTERAIKEHIEGASRIVSRAYNALFLALADVAREWGAVFETSLTDRERSEAQTRYLQKGNLLTEHVESRYDPNLRSYYPAADTLGALPESDLPQYRAGRIDELELAAASKVHNLVGAVGRMAWHAPANADQQAAVQQVAAERQKGTLAIRRARTAGSVRTALDAAKRAIAAVEVAGGPVWQTGQGNPLPVVSGTYRPGWSWGGGALRTLADVRAANPGTDAKYGDVFLEVESIDDDLRASFKTPAGDGRAHEARLIYGSASEPVAPLRATLVARNAVAASRLEVEWRKAPPRFTNRLGHVVFTRGARESLDLGAAAGGFGTLTYSMDQVPPGMVFDPATRLLSGTPTRAASAAEYSCKATDQAGQIGWQLVEITVLEPA